MKLPRRPSLRLVVGSLVGVFAMITLGVALAEDAAHVEDGLVIRGPAPSTDLLPRPDEIPLPTAEQIRQMKEFHAKGAPGEVQRAAAGFNVRLPSALPAGTVLAHAAASEEKSDAGESLHSLGVWFVLPSGDELHIWQTDGQLTDKDPVSNPRSTDLPVKGVVWKRAKTDFAGIDSFSTRFSDGVTLSIDFPVAEVKIEAILSSLESVARP